MMRISVELSGESLPLALAELEGACEAVGGHGPVSGPEARTGRTVEVDLPDAEAARALAGRLAFAYRCIEFRGAVDSSFAPRWDPPLRPGTSAAIRWLGHARRGGEDPIIAEFGGAWVSAGGTIDLSHPQRRFWLRKGLPGRTEVGEEVGTVDRSGLLSRRMSRLPFQRPVGLDPRFARASVNLAQVRPGDRVVDPFVGTGALLAEAALLGARVTGIDVDPEMVRGAARNFAYLGVHAEAWVAGDAAEVSSAGSLGDPFDALVTDVPYGRSSGTRGEPVELLLRRVLPLWAERVRPGGRIVIVSAGDADPLGSPWRRVRGIQVRQHRSLTRTFAIYERGAGSTPPTMAGARR